MRELNLEALAKDTEELVSRYNILHGTRWAIGHLVTELGIEKRTITSVLGKKRVSNAYFGKICYRLGKQPMDYFSRQRNYEVGEVNTDRFSNDILLYLGNLENNVNTIKDLAYATRVQEKQISKLLSGKKMNELNASRASVGSYERLARYIGIEDGLEHYKVTKEQIPIDPLFEGVEAYSTLFGYVIGKPQEGVNGASQVVLDAAFKAPSETVSRARSVLQSGQVRALQSIYKGASRRGVLEDGLRMTVLGKPTSLSN